MKALVEALAKDPNAARSLIEFLLSHPELLALVVGVIPANSPVPILRYLKEHTDDAIQALREEAAIQQKHPEFFKAIEASIPGLGAVAVSSH